VLNSIIGHICKECERKYPRGVDAIVLLILLRVRESYSINKNISRKTYKTSIDTL